MESWNEHGMLVQSRRTMRIIIRKSTIKPNVAELGCYAGEQFRKQMVTRNCNGTVICFILYVDKLVEKWYKKAGM